MKLKKNKNKDLNLKRGLYFVLGLLLILLLLYIVLEWKTSNNTNGYEIDSLSNIESNEHPSSIVLTTKTKTSTPLPITDSIQKTEDEFIEIIDCGFDSDVEEIIGCFMIEEPPIFPGCENSTDKKNCFSTMVSKHLSKNFHYPESTANLYIQGKVYVRFVVDKDGTIGEIKTRGPHKSLELAARQAIEKLPKVIPAKHRGKAMRVSFSIPIIIN